MTDSCGIHIFYSARVERLALALNNDITRYRKKHQDPLKPLNVIVPNGHIQTYLNRFLTNINGIVANMAFPFLETGLFQALSAMQTHHQPPPLLSVRDIELAIWGFLRDQNNRKKALLSPLYDYLYARQNPALIAQKTWQLTQQLALLFIDYELTRPELITNWLTGELFFKDSHNARLKKIETAQREVYLNLFQESTHGLTLNGLLRTIKATDAAKTQPVFLFVPSRLSPLHRHVMQLLAQHSSVYIYHFNVCREFWLDLETAGEKNWRQSIQQLKVNASDAAGDTINDKQTSQASELKGETFFDLDEGIQAFENPLLKAWGKPGRETLRLLSDLENDAIQAGIVFQDHLLDENEVADRQPDSTLRAMQYAILNRIPGGDRLPPLKDTVQLAAAPSIEVEVAQIYNSILYELKQNPDLQLTDIVVLVTDMSAYRYVIEQVFDRLNRHVISPLRYSISDSHAGEESLYARAIQQIIDTIDSDFVRDKVFTLLANPCVMTALDNHQADIDAWRQTVVDLGVYRGFKRLYHANDKSTDGLFTWQQGLQRLHRSLVQSDADSTSLSSHEIGRLSVIMSALNHFKERLDQPQTGHQWQRALQTLLDTFIAVPDDYPQEEAVALSVSRDLQELADSQSDLMLSYDDIKQYVLTRLSEMKAGRGRYLSGGVVCAALQPMRPVPFKLTYILGLGESQFPGQIRHNTLDLATYSRRIGDINQVENNKYLFLETIMSTREKLFLSYLGRDAQTGDSLAPSAVVNDVLDWFKQHCMRPLKTIHLPLSPADNFKRQSTLPNPSLMQNHTIGDYLLYRQNIQTNETWSEQELDAMSEQQQAEIKRFQALVKNTAQHEATKTEHESEIELSVANLSDYLINPTTTLFAHQGGVLTRIEDTDLLSDEPLSMNPLTKHQLFNQAVAEDLSLFVNMPDEQADIDTDLGNLLQQHYLRYLRQSRVPIELFGAIESLKEISKTEHYQEIKNTIQSRQLRPWRGDLQMGSTYSTQTLAQQLPALTLAGPHGQSYYLSAAVSHLLNNKHDQIAAQVVIRAGSYTKNKYHELMAKAFLEWCVMQQHSALYVAEAYQVWLIFQDKIMIRTFDRHLVDNGMLKNYLIQVCHDFTHGNNAHLPLGLQQALSFTFSQDDAEQPAQLYPFKSQFYFAYKELPAYLRDQLIRNYHQALANANEIESTFGTSASPSYNEIKSLLRYRPSNDVLQEYRTRFMLFFALLEQVDLRNPL